MWVRVTKATSTVQRMQSRPMARAVLDARMHRKRLACAPRCPRTGASHRPGAHEISLRSPRVGRVDPSNRQASVPTRSHSLQGPLRPLPDSPIHSHRPQPEMSDLTGDPLPLPAPSYPNLVAAYLRMSLLTAEHTCMSRRLGTIRSCALRAQASDANSQAATVLPCDLSRLSDASMAAMHPLRQP